MGGGDRLSSSGRWRALGVYTPVRVIATGGMGAVFEVHDPRTGVSYAAKTILKSDPGAVARFRREAELLARCDRHPGIVKVHAFGETADGAPYMILDLVKGETLHQLVKREAPLEPLRAARLARDIARALGAMHAQGIVHRDVKPSNVLLDADAGGAPRLTDFGLASARDLERLTRTGQFLGTVVYCAPEQALALGPIGPPADVFALGCVLFEMLAGEPAIVARETVQHLANLASDEPMRSVRAVRREVPEPLASIVAMAIAKKPEDRYEDANALADDLDLFLAGKPPTSASGGRRWRVPQRTVSLAAAVALVVVVAVVALVAALRSSDGRREALDGVRVRLDAAVAAVEDARRAGVSPASSASACVARARAAVDAARTAATEAPLSGPARLSLVGEAQALDVDLVAIEAGRALALGDAARALAVLDGFRPRQAPGIEGSPDGLELRLLRARALAALGRDEAAREAEAVAALLPERQRGEALELAGDAHLSRGRAREALRAYDEALRGSKKPALRAKHAAAADAAGERALREEDLAALAPALASLADVRSANAALAPLAPVLYRRGLGGGPQATRERDLDLAWLLGPPPPELANDVARFWIARCSAFVATTLGDSKERSRESLAQLAEALARVRRTVELAPAADVDGLFAIRGGLRFWYEMELNPVNRNELVAALCRAWADDPVVLFLAAKIQTFDEIGGHRRALELLARAADALPPPETHADVRALAADILRDAATRGSAAPDSAVPVERFERAVAVCGTVGARLSYGVLLVTRGRFAEARALLDSVASDPEVSGGTPTAGSFAELELEVRMGEGRPEAALAWAKERGIIGYAVRWFRLRARWEETLAIGEPAIANLKRAEVDTIASVYRALLELDRKREAEDLHRRAEAENPGAKAALFREELEWQTRAEAGGR